jgi:hypothetical protein
MRRLFAKIKFEFGNGAGGGEMEYDGREAGSGVGAGKEGDMGRSGQIGGGNRRPAPSQSGGRESLNEGHSR